MSEPAFAPGWVAPEVAEELPGLRLLQATLPGGTGRSSPGVRERLGHLSRRMTGAEAVATRTRPVPQAYRRLFRHIGLDPDEHHVPVEAAIVRRLRHGGYRPDNALDDALTVAVVETAVPLWALDADAVEGDLGVRPASAGERLERGEYPDELPPGRLVVADDRGVAAVLFGRLAEDRLVTARTRALRVFTVLAPGVPEVHADEALWTFTECLAAA